MLDEPPQLLGYSGRLSGGNPTVNCIVQGQLVKVWNGSGWVREYSENPAWIIRDF